MTKLRLVVANTKPMRLNRNRTPSSVFLYGNVGCKRLLVSDDRVEPETVS